MSDKLDVLPEWAVLVAATCWCEPATSMIEVDIRLAMVFASRLAEERERCAKIVETHDRFGDPVQCWFDLLAAAIRKEPT